MESGKGRVFANRQRSLDRLQSFGLPIRIADAEDIEPLLSLTKELLPLSAVDREAAMAVHRRNAESFLIVDGPDGPIGYAALLLLNSRGLDALLAGGFRFERPDLNCLAPTGEAPAGIYVWALCMKGRAVSSLAAIMEWAKRDGREKAHLYSRPTTAEGERFIRRGGFHPIVCGQADLWRYERALPHDAPIAA